MSNGERLVQFELLGQAFSVYTGESEEDMGSILELVRSAFEVDPSVPMGSIPAAKVAVLGSLTLAADYVKLQREFQEYREASQGRIAQLGENIQRCLGDES